MVKSSLSKTGKARNHLMQFEDYYGEHLAYRRFTGDIGNIKGFELADIDYHPDTGEEMIRMQSTSKSSKKLPRVSAKMRAYK